MTDEQFEKHLEARLRNLAEGGVRPFDAIEIARLAMTGNGRQVVRQVRRGAPAWFRSLALAALLLVILVAAAFAGGFIRLPGPIVAPTPTASTVAISPTPFPSPTVDPSLSPSASPAVSPSASPPVSPSPSASPSATPSASPSATPTATPAAGWQEIDFPGNAGRTDVSDVAYLNGTYVAVGQVTQSVPAEAIFGRAWYSRDGATWTRAQENGMWPSRVVATADAFISIDGSGPQVTIWRSVDGTSWTQIGSTSVLGFVNDMAFENGVMVAVGTTNDFDQAMVWTSADGISWTAIAAPDAASELTRVELRGGDIVVIGDDFNGHGRRIFVRRDHTVGWEEIVPFGDDVDGRLLDLATNGGRFVAAGYEDDFDTGERLATVRTSVDLTTWTRAVAGNGDSLIFDQVVALPDFRFLAVASVPSYIVGECQPSGCVELHEQGQAWLSDDGVSWQLDSQIYERGEPAPDEIGDMIEHPRAVAAGASGVVVLDRWFGALHVFFAPLSTFAE